MCVSCFQRSREPNLELALAILFHDVGKKPTAKVDENGRIRFNEHESVGAEMAEQIMTGLRPNSSTTIQTVTAELVQHHMQFKDVPHMRPSTLKRMMARPTFAPELELHRIDCSSSHGDLKHYDFLKQLIETMSAEEIDPDAVHHRARSSRMGLLGPGKAIGRILEAVRIACNFQKARSPNSRRGARARARKLAHEDEEPS